MTSRNILLQQRESYQKQMGSYNEAAEAFNKRVAQYNEWGAAYNASNGQPMKTERVQSVDEYGNPMMTRDYSTGGLTPVMVDQQVPWQNPLSSQPVTSGFGGYTYDLTATPGASPAVPDAPEFTAAEERTINGEKTFAQSAMESKSGLDKIKDQEAWSPYANSGTGMLQRVLQKKL